ncbi:aspartate/glutamate racemase family protein [Gordonia insulae]|uniref:Hydantoin racemase n=1 Tax=Gordonia insulae TaxID=2420509 RepID=A0A3G8JSD5_9ACTN|nr:aspartate/glutamate racemase family protein [Gordonia insulae]AZG47997.1 hypothetical protein D7316_04609 [Gordonia insulae]
MNLTIINPNRLDQCTRRIDEYARRWFPDIDISVVAPTFGPRELAGEYETQLCATGVLDQITGADPTTDAFVLAGFAEPGTEAAREVAACPVVDITEAGPMRALLFGRRYAIITSTRAVIPAVEDRIRCLGLDQRALPISAVDMGVAEMLDKPDDLAGAVERELHRLARAGHTGAVVLGCGGMTGVAERVAIPDGITVVDPVRAAVATAAAIVAEQSNRTESLI